MSRLDVPTLQCDRCKSVTQDNKEMAKFITLSHHNISGLDQWDLCPVCWPKFYDFLGEA